MKLKKKHYKIAKTISYFVDRTDLYFPDFVEPSEQQIELFFEIETIGKKNLTEDELQIVAPMMNGKSNYDLQIKMIYEELLDWMCQKWGWWYPISQVIKDSYKERHQFPAYIKFLRNLKKKMTISKDKKIECLAPSIEAMLSFSGFSPEQKNRLLVSVINP